MLLPRIAMTPCLLCQPNLAAIDADGKTALLRAMRSYYVEDGRCTVMLLEAGASLDAVGHDDLCGFAATSTAAIQALINRGVNLRELVDRYGGTPLHMAARRKLDLSDVFDMLDRVCGIDLEARDRSGKSCALVAVQCDNVFALRWLIKADVDVDCLSSDGSNSLWFVRDPECAVALIAAGVDACARNKLGRTALQHALAVVPRFHRHLHVLLAAGAHLDDADNRGRTARQVLSPYVSISPTEIEVARRDIAKARIDLVRYRALKVCIGLQLLELDALQMCEILQFACGRVAPLIPFHIWWKIATTVKHFQSK
jgi:ankyrin repeat protein